MKLVAIAIAGALSACAYSTAADSAERLTIVQVVRLTEQREIKYVAQPLSPPSDPPLIHVDVRFRVESPDEYRGREIVLPISSGIDGVLFKGKVFMVRIPTCFLEGKDREEVKLPDGSTRVTWHAGFDFDALLVNQPNQSADRMPGSNAPGGSSRH